VSSFEEVVPKLIDSTVEIFSAMVMMDIEVAGEPMDSLGPMRDSITGMVGLAGTGRGVLAVHIPNKVAMAITSSFLGMEVDEINEDVQDAVGEIANMLGGNVKTILADRFDEIELSLPSTISGEEYVFLSQNDVDQIIIPFAVPDGKIHVELELERS